jgi:ribosomal protein S18 acetylase RimI-like enzyme
LRRVDVDRTERAIDLQSDPWLTRVLAREAFHLELSESPDSAARISSHLPDGPAFVDIKHPVRDVAGLGILVDAGFRMIDTQVSLDRDGPLSTGSPSGAVRFATPDDKASVGRVASTSFSLSRFHLDPAIHPDTANRLKESWAQNFFEGTRGDHMVVAEAKGQAVGFLQLIANGNTLVIDLIAIDAAHRGKRLGEALIGFAAAECRPDRMVVGTQICNVPSLRLYERLGFRVTDASYVLHRHS